MVAGADGSSPRVLATRPAPDVLSPIYFAAPTWSPDGKLIVTPVESRGERPRATLAALGSSDGVERPFQSYEWASGGHGSAERRGLRPGGRARDGREARRLLRRRNARRTYGLRGNTARQRVVLPDWRGPVTVTTGCRPARRRRGPRSRRSMREVYQKTGVN